MERTLASFPWPGYDSIRSWGSQVCVCVSPRFVSAPGHAGHAPVSLSPPNPTPTVLSQHIDGRREVERERRNPLTPVSKCTRGGGPSDGRTDTPHDSRHTARGRKRWRADAPRPKQIHDGVCSCTPTGPGWTSSPLPSPATWQRRNFRIQTRDACDRRMRWIRHGRPSNRGERRMRDACYV